MSCTCRTCFETSRKIENGKWRMENYRKGFPFSVFLSGAYRLHLILWYKFYHLHNIYRRVRQGELQNTGTTSNTTMSIICTRITAGANIVRPQTVRFYAVREHTVLPYGITCTKSLNSERRGRTAGHLFLRHCRTSPCRSLRYTFHNAI